MAWSASISLIVLLPLIASMATLALNSGLWVRRLLILAEQLKAMAGQEGLSFKLVLVKMFRNAAERVPAGVTVLQRLEAIERRLDALGG